MVLFGVGLTGLVTSLGGLFAVDICPKRVAGAAMGLIGIFSYIGAAMQENISGHLIERGMTRRRRRAHLRLQHRRSGSGSARRSFPCCWPPACGASSCAIEERLVLASRFDFVSVGAYTKDTIVTRTGTRYVDGGGYSYSAHAARLADISVGAVTRLAAEDRKSTDLLRSVGVEVIVRESAHSTLMRLEYPTDNVDERILTVAEVADPFVPADLDSSHRRGDPDQPLDPRRSAARRRGSGARARPAASASTCRASCASARRRARLAYEAWPEMQAGARAGRRAQVGCRRR